MLFGFSDYADACYTITNPRKGSSILEINPHNRLISGWATPHLFKIQNATLSQGGILYFGLYGVKEPFHIDAKIPHERKQKGTKKADSICCPLFSTHFLFIRSNTPAVYSLQLYCTMYSPCQRIPIRLPSHQS